MQQEETAKKACADSAISSAGGVQHGQDGSSDRRSGDVNPDGDVQAASAL